MGRQDLISIRANNYNLRVFEECMVDFYCLSMFGFDGIDLRRECFN